MKKFIKDLATMCYLAAGMYGWVCTGKMTLISVKLLPPLPVTSEYAKPIILQREKSRPLYVVRSTCDASRCEVIFSSDKPKKKQK